MVTHRPALTAALPGPLTRNPQRGPEKASRGQKGQGRDLPLGFACSACVFE